MVARSEELGLFADVKMPAQILLEACFVQRIYLLCKQLGKAVGGCGAQYPHTALFKQSPCIIKRVEHKGEVIKSKTLLVIVSGEQVALVIDHLGHYHHVVADKGEKYPAAVLAYTLCLGYAAQSVGFGLKMI